MSTTLDVNMPGPAIGAAPGGAAPAPAPAPAAAGGAPAQGGGGQLAGAINKFLTVFQQSSPEEDRQALPALSQGIQQVMQTKYPQIAERMGGGGGAPAGAGPAAGPAPGGPPRAVPTGPRAKPGGSVAPV